jgi:hypothetical protein
MKSQAFQFQHIPTEAKIEKEAAAFTADIHKTNKETFCKCRPPYPKASLWWNAACAIAAQTLHKAQTAKDRSIAQARLKGTV